MWSCSKPGWAAGSTRRTWSCRKSAVITPIDFDHEAFLGSSIEAIAAEKAGILKRGCPAVFAPQRPEALAVLEQRARELEIDVTSSGSPLNVDLHHFGSRFVWNGVPLNCPFAGEHQVDNAATAAAAMTALEVPVDALQRGIAQAKWPGRLQRVAVNPDIILDGAHNPAGARALAHYIRRFFTAEPVRIVFGAMRDKAFDEVTNLLFPLAEEVVLTMPKQPRALHPDAIREVVDHPQLVVTDDLAMALAHVRAHSMTTFITGSLYLVGEALEIYNPDRAK